MGSRFLTIGWCLVIAGCPGSGSDEGGSSEGGATTGTGATSTGSEGTAPGTSTGDTPTTGPGPGETSSSETSGVETGTAETGPGETSTATSTSTTSTSTTTTEPGDTSSGDTSDTGDTSGGPGPALPLVVENHGFESDFVANGNYNDKIVPASWVKYDPQNIIGLNYNSLGVLNPTGTILYPGGAPQGSNVALVFLWRDQTNGMPAGIEQVLGHSLQADREYRLRVKVGNIAPEMGVPYDLGGFPGYRIELLAGDIVLVADDDTLSPAEGEFVQSEIVHVSSPGDPGLGMSLKIRLINLNQADSGIEVNFDDVQLTAAPL